MLEPRDIAEKKFNEETHSLIGKKQLQHYGKFLENYHNQILKFKSKLQNNLYIRTEQVAIKSETNENVSLMQLVHSDNKLLSRILASLVSLCQEIDYLVKEAQENYYVIFVFYGEDVGKGTENLQAISKLIEILHKVQCFVKRSQEVIVLLLKQLCAILGKEFNGTTTTTCFPEAFDYLAELLVCLLILDNLLLLPMFKEHWSLYRRSIRSMLHSPSQFDVSSDNLRALDKQLCDIENDLLTGSILYQTVAKCENIVSTLKSCNIGNEFIAFINQMLTELERDDENIFFTQIWLQVNVIFVFHHRLFGNTDKKIIKHLMDINKKGLACTLAGNIVWYPEIFLIQHIPSIEKYLNIKSFSNYRLTQITLRSQNLQKETHTLCLQSCQWMIEIERVVKQNVSSTDAKHLQESRNLLLEGIKLVKKISEMVKWISNLHAHEEKPMHKSVSLALCKLIEVLKCFQMIFQKNSLQLIYIITLISQQLTHKALLLLHNIKKNSTQEKSYKEKHLNVLSSLAVTEQALKGPNTRQRILVAKLSLSESGLENETIFELRSVLNRLELMCCVHSILNRLCDCSFLYWHQVLLPLYFTKLINSKQDLSRFYLLLDAVTDCSKVAGNSIIKSTFKYFKNNLLEPLNQLVETNLRLQTHLHLQLPSSDPFQNSLPFTFKNIKPALLGDNYVNIKQEVEHYLSTIFYNLTTVILHDWRTYGEMKCLAFLQYGLNTVDDCLPMQTLEQGLDVLEIMRNIHIFVGKYLYNLNNQVFVEEWSNNKHLNTINISHVANSIRTHGLGIMNTTVNFTYQFLQNKFFIFSQFMFDEHIKSRLVKDLRYFNENKINLNQMYPYERAEKFNFGIRKLGLNQNGLSYLDLFRKLITTIGNAMGYIRLIRSGGRRCLADGTCFIPDLKGVDNFTELLDKQNLSLFTTKSANCLKRDINNLVENFEEATEYFKLLVKVFAPVFRNPQNKHLKNFYIIVPPLTINFVEHSLNCKERLNKKNKDGAAFADDGFAMGLAYIIELLEQQKQLNSLHWFHSIKNKYIQDINNLNIQKNIASKEDCKLQQTLTLTEKKINALDREFQLLNYSFSSARIFFQS